MLKDVIPLALYTSKIELDSNGNVLKEIGFPKVVNNALQD